MVCKPAYTIKKIRNAKSRIKHHDTGCEISIFTDLSRKYPAEIRKRCFFSRFLCQTKETGRRNLAWVHLFNIHFMDHFPVVIYTQNKFLLVVQ